MTRTRGLIAGAVVACLAVVGAIVLLAGNDDGPRTFMARSAESALLVDWTRAGNEVTGSLTYAHLVRPTPGIFDTTTTTEATPRDVQRDNTAFTGTISQDSVRLRVTAGPFGPQLTGQLEGDTLKLMIPQGSGQQTISLSTANRPAFDAAVARLRTAEAQRVRKARTTREDADTAARSAITRVATAYVRALDPRSLDDPCRYVTAAAKAELLKYATPKLRASGCKAIVRFREREQNGASAPRQLGVATIDLRQPIRVPSESSGRLVDGAELRFPAIPNHPIGLIREHGQWRIAAPAGTV